MTDVKQKKFSWGWIVGVVVVIALGIGGFYFYQYESEYVSTNDAFIDGFRIDLSPDILGRIVELTVDEGDFVQRGQIVAVIQQDIFESQKLEAEAALESAIKNVALQKAHLEKVRNDYWRAEQGIRDQIISPQDFDHKQKDFEMAAAAFTKAEADAFHAETKVNLINTYLNHTLIYAPFDGQIAKRWVFTGDVMRPGQSIFTMYDQGQIWVQANLSETKIKKVKLGDEVEISVDAYPDRKFYGKIFTIKSAAASQFSVIPQNNATGNYTKVAQRIPVKISLIPAEPTEPLYLFPGMNVEVKIKI